MTLHHTTKDGVVGLLRERKVENSRLVPQDHAIFALHYHSFWFSVFILSQFNLPKSINSVLLPLLLLAAAYYFVSALHNVYKINFGKSIVTTIVIGISYSLLLAVVFLASLVIIVAAA